RLGESPLGLTPIRDPWILKIEHDRDIELAFHIPREQHRIKWTSGEQDNVDLSGFDQLRDCTPEVKKCTQPDASHPHRSRERAGPGSYFAARKFPGTEPGKTGVEPLLIVSLVETHDDRFPAGGGKMLGKMARAMNARHRTRREFKRDDEDA